MPRYALAVDVGGTFTDVVLCELETGAQTVHKTPSTPDDPSVGFMSGLSEILRSQGVPHGDLAHVFHGTTIATNSVLENKGASVGLLVTGGYKYVLEIARHGTPRLANPNTWVKPERPVKPRDCLEVSERTAFDGEILRPLEEADVIRAAQHFARAGVAAIAVAFLHSYANPTHERRAREILERELPGIPVSLSSDVLPVYREYERAITTVLNAYVTPRVSRYIDNLKRSLDDSGVSAPLSIMKSNGGIIGADTAVRQPVYTALSGPAAGVMAAVQIAETTGIENCISFDMGGTSTDVSLLRNRHPGLTLNGRLGDWPVQLPMLDIATIGCGGGSIASVSPYGSLTVGPDSAGADPGPACYGRGAALPAVTDANLVLGRVSAEIAGGQLVLDTDAAYRAVSDLVAARLNLDVPAAANGILKIANNAMVGAIRNISVERGHDPRDFALVAYGGAGPMHAIDVANLLGIKTVVVPTHPGTTSAYGLLAAEFKNDYARTFPQRAPDYDLDGMTAVFADLRQEGIDWLDGEGIPTASHAINFSADLRYAHQGSELTIPYRRPQINREGFQQMLQDFHAEHQQLYGFSLDQPVEIVTLRVTASGQVGQARMQPIPLPTHQSRPSASHSRTPTHHSHSPACHSRSPIRHSRFRGNPPSPTRGEGRSEGYRPVYFDEGSGFVDCPIYQRAGLPPGSELSGPAILEGMDSTVVINPGWQARIDQYGNCIMQSEGNRT